MFTDYRMVVLYQTICRPERSAHAPCGENHKEGYYSGT